MIQIEQHVGAALRHLRLHGGSEPRKQLEVAAAAGITRGMLSSYERGKQDPSLKNLERVLRALGADLVQLQWAIHMVEARPEAESGTGKATEGGAPRGDTAWAAGPPPPSMIGEGGATPGTAATSHRTIRLPGPLSADEERALGELFGGILAWLRYSRGSRRQTHEGGEGTSAPPPP